MTTYSERLQRGPGALGGTPQAGMECHEIPIEVVTLLHGGGPVASEGDHPQTPTRHPDTVTVIRGSAVRGQLRFWWRATRASHGERVAELRKDEDELWGNASSPGKVTFAIDQSGLRFENVKTDTLGNIGQGLRYGAFAASNVTRVKGSATLRLWLPTNQKQQVLTAVDAWILFGGIGGRTRRGFGAVWSPRATTSAQEFIASLGGKQVASSRLPLLQGATLALSQATFANAEEAHRHAVDALRRFRQEPGFARNKGEGNRPGRSRWPEPDSIRRITKKYASQHSPTHPVQEAFPRAAFGMPIVFHFKDREEKGGTLTANGGGRMASPLILRPTKLNGKWHAMALRLSVQECGDAFLDGRKVNVMIDANDARHIDPLHAHGDNPDVLAAFLEFFTKR